MPPGLPHIAVSPTPANGLRVPSYIMVEKILAARRTKCGNVVGHLEPAMMEQVNTSLALVIGLAD